MKRWFVAGALAVVLPQLLHWREVGRSYFNAAGESIISPAAIRDLDHYGGWTGVFLHVLDNARITLRMLFWPVHPWRPLVGRLWHHKETLLPPPLMPLLAIGIVCVAREAIRFPARRREALAVALALVLGAVPGVFAAYDTTPNAQRSALLVLPVYFLIARAIVLFFEQSREKITVWLIVVLVMVLAIDQTNRYFDPLRNDYEVNAPDTVARYVVDYFAGHPNAHVLVAVDPTRSATNEMVLFQGGETLVDRARSHQLDFADDMGMIERHAYPVERYDTIVAPVGKIRHALGLERPRKQLVPYYQIYSFERPEIPP
jgi:hypothetical protein